MAEHYQNVNFGKLSDLITPEKFRTVDEQMRSIPMGITEFAVEIHIKEKTREQLSFKIPWDGIVYGCARSKKELRNKLEFESDIRIAYINDWDDRFLVLFELENSSEKPIMYVQSTEVVYLLENCLRIPEQDSGKD